MPGDRKLSNWLRAYGEFTARTEPPATFHLWVGISMMAAAMQRKLYIDAGHFIAHSNMYIVLVSPPGRSKKGTAMKIGKGILKGIDDYAQEIHFSTQASSVAALVSQMSKIENKAHQSLTSISWELGSLLGSKTDEMTMFLTDIFDCEPDWDKQTIGRGLEKISAPWLNLLAGTTPQWMGDNLSRTALEGGFVGRTVFVYEDSRRLISFRPYSEDELLLKRELIHDLAHIAGKAGQFVFSPEGQEFWDDWYEDESRLNDIDYRLSGYYERKPIQVLKLAMVYSLSVKDELIITPDDLGRALDTLAEIEPGMYKAFQSVGKNIYSVEAERIRSQIRSAGAISLRKVVSLNSRDLELEQIMKILQTLEYTEEIHGGWQRDKIIRVKEAA